MSFRLSPGCDCCEVDYCIRPNINWPGYTPFGGWSTISDCCWQRDFVPTTTPGTTTLDSAEVYRWFQRAETYHRIFGRIGTVSGSTCIDHVDNYTIAEAWCKFIRDWRRKLRMKVTPTPSFARLTVYLSFYSGVPYYNFCAETDVSIEIFPLVSDLNFTDYIYEDSDCFTGRDSGTGVAIAKGSYDTEPTQPPFTEGTRIAIINPVRLKAYGRVAAATLTTSYTSVSFSSGDADLPSSDSTPCLNGLQQDYTYTYNFGSITPIVPSVGSAACSITGAVETAVPGFGGSGKCYVGHTRRPGGGLPALFEFSYLTLEAGCCDDLTQVCESNSTTIIYQREAEITSESVTTSSTDAVLDADFATTVEIALWA